MLSHWEMSYGFLHISCRYEKGKTLSPITALWPFLLRQIWAVLTLQQNGIFETHKTTVVSLPRNYYYLEKGIHFYFEERNLSLTILNLIRTYCLKSPTWNFNESKDAALLSRDSLNQGKRTLRCTLISHKDRSQCMNVQLWHQLRW